eukprot:CAMPEP_0180607332 /NCGR_PEP_ID=MMETSP1037_2-20121125/27649_1 /TAXON_ID=632150 /ORGANISM="Azadinium spinosum, Strain 3D9" /LENGTH=278 /DNA_ID=CAMNT_0022626615 /DNA_START=64 /DNA_END=898 /DNA_ORIENTATION=-
MKIFVQYKEGDDLEAHWRQQVTLPKKWLGSPCDRLTRYLVENYNKARPSHTPLLVEAWHLSNESKGRCEALGRENVISEVIGEFDEVFLRPGTGQERTTWRRAEALPSEATAASVLVPVEFSALVALRKAVDADDTEALQRAVDEANLASPHEMLMAETDIKDADGKILGTEWHGLAGAFAWEKDGDGGSDPSAKVTLTEYARRRGAEKVLKIIEVADHCGAPIMGGARGRLPEDIEASANSVADKMGELNVQLRDSLNSGAALREQGPMMKQVPQMQ